MVTGAQLCDICLILHFSWILTFYIWKSQSKTTRSEHMETFYKTFSEIKDRVFRRVDRTGARLNSSLRKVDYWRIASD